MSRLCDVLLAIIGEAVVTVSNGREALHIRVQ